MKVVVIFGGQILIQICNEGYGGGVEGGDEGGDDLQWTNFDPNIQTW